MELLQFKTKEPLYVLWIETNFGDFEDSDWEMNSDPQTLNNAVKEAIEVSKKGWICLICPEGITPRPDKLFSNPLTS